MFLQEFLESISAKLPVGQIANTPYAKLLSNLSKHTRTHSPKPVEQPGDRRFGWCCELLCKFISLNVSET